MHVKAIIEMEPINSSAGALIIRFILDTPLVTNWSILRRTPFQLDCRNYNTMPL